VTVARDPLRAVAGVRRTRAEQAAAALARAIGERAAASADRRAAEKDLSAHQLRGRETADGHRTALDRGELVAGDLAGLDASRRRSSAEEQALALRLRRVADGEKAAIQKERSARSALFARATDAQVAATLVARRDAEAARKAESRAEEAAGDAWRPKR
jgi:hypothetical protein